MMTERAPETGGRSARFDRVETSRGRSAHARDHEGKEALYSTAPSAAPSAQVQIVCQRCDVETGLSVLATVRLLRPPFLWNPLNGKLWARCPACGQRATLRVRQGQALRAFLDRG